MTNSFARFTALSFDCYGTLIDWERGIAAELEHWCRLHGGIATAEEAMTLFARYETEVQQEMPGTLYPEVLAEALRRIDAHHGVTTSPEQIASFADSVRRWPAFPDTSAALGRLAERYRLIILSNIDRASFATSLPKLGTSFDLVVTAQDVGAYKPSPASFPALLAAIASIGVESSALLHVAQSLYHDHEPAQAAGLATVWIDRRHDQPGFGATPPPQAAVTPTWRFTSLAAFADVACS